MLQLWWNKVHFILVINSHLRFYSSNMLRHWLPDLRYPLLQYHSDPETKLFAGVVPMLRHWLPDLRYPLLQYHSDPETKLFAGVVPMLRHWLPDLRYPLLQYHSDPETKLFAGVVPMLRHWLPDLRYPLLQYHSDPETKLFAGWLKVCALETPIPSKSSARVKQIVEVNFLTGKFLKVVWVFKKVEELESGSTTQELMLKVLFWHSWFYSTNHITITINNTFTNLILI